MAKQNLFPHHLFGNYIIELAKLFRLRFKDFKLTPQGDDLSLQVFYGTPRAAFRYWYERFNGQLILPLLNFHGADMRRRYDKECPNIHLRLYTMDEFSHYDGKVSTTYSPMHFDVTYSFSLYNNSYRERDKIIHKIMQLFARGQRSIRWYPDPENYPKIFLFMPLQLDESINDETEIEGLDQNETRNIIRTNFTIVSQAVVPYDVIRIPAVTEFIINNKINENYEHYGFVSINQELGNRYYDYKYISAGKQINFFGNSEFE